MCAQYLGRIRDEAGFSVTYHDFSEDHTSLIARTGNGGKPPLGFTGHIDTVPLGANPWAMDPFAA